MRARPFSTCSATARALTLTGTLPTAGVSLTYSGEEKKNVLGEYFINFTMFLIFSSQGGTPLPCLETFIGDSAFSEVSFNIFYHS